MKLDDLTMPRFEEGLKNTLTIIIPLGSIEEHGPHLPLGTDTFQVEEVCRRAGRRAGAFAAPALPYGVCRSTADHPGTIGISTPTLRLMILDLGHSCYRQGLRNFIFISGHAGKTHLMAILDAGERLMEELDDIRVAVVSEYGEVLAKGREIIETEEDSHAGEVETSRILCLHPELVDGTAPEEYPSFPPHILVRNKRPYWPGGVWGNPSRASAEKGERLMEIAVDNLVDIIRRLESFEG